MGHAQSWRCVIALALFGALVSSAGAQSYPTRPITIVVASAPGGPGDTAARLIVDRMSALLGQQVVVENVPGAGGTTGTARVARAEPDGHTLLIHQNGLTIAPALYAKLPFDVAKDFVAVGLVNRSYSYLVGRKSLPASTLPELVMWMKGPGKPARHGHPGMGTVGHLSTVLFGRAVGAELNMIPYRGAAPAMNDIVGGHIDLLSAGVSTSGTLIRSGEIKAYASTAPQREAALPNVPTFTELGFKELERPLWHALFAPAATPPAIIARLNTALNETMADPAVQKAYAERGVESFPREQWSVEAARTYVSDELVRWGRVVRENDVKAE
jgi:tripartite-type tricarboxylate transporter receptor subunit TctC